MHNSHEAKVLVISTMFVLLTSCGGSARPPNTGLKPPSNRWYCLDNGWKNEPTSPESYASCMRTKDDCEAVRAKNEHPEILACAAHNTAYCFTYSEDNKGDYNCFESSHRCDALHDVQQSLLQGDSYSGHKFEISGCGTW